MHNFSKQDFIPKIVQEADMLKIEATEMKLNLSRIVEIANMHTCSLCGAKFSHADFLQYHKSVHGSLGYFNCTICNYTANKEENLKLHFSLHARQPYVAMNPVSKDLSLSGQNIGPVYKCDKCPFKTEIKGAVMTHQRLQDYFHHDCEFCPHKTKYRGCLEDHAAKIHISSPTSVSRSASMQQGSEEIVEGHDDRHFEKRRHNKDFPSNLLIDEAANNYLHRNIKREVIFANDTDVTERHEIYQSKEGGNDVYRSGSHFPNFRSSPNLMICSNGIQSKIIEGYSLNDKNASSNEKQIELNTNTNKVIDFFLGKKVKQEVISDEEDYEAERENYAHKVMKNEIDVYKPLTHFQNHRSNQSSIFNPNKVHFQSCTTHEDNNDNKNTSNYEKVSEFQLK